MDASDNPAGIEHAVADTPGQTQHLRTGRGHENGNVLGRLERQPGAPQLPHDAFLLHEPELFETVAGFLSAAALRRGLKDTEPADAAM